MDKDRDEISQLTLIAARYEAICDILDGLEVSDFMESFPEVRQVADLYAASQQPASADPNHDAKICRFVVCQFADRCNTKCDWASGR